MKRIGYYFLGGALACSASALIFACISEHARPVSDGGTTGNSIDCDSGGPGGFPPPNCDPSDNSCPGAGTCAMDPSTCGDPATCRPLAENKGKPTYDLRLRRLLITAPPSLAGNNIGFGVLQATVIDKGIDLAAPACGDTQGNGAFSWIMRVDPTGNTIKTGGAPPSPDPKNKGYCFYNYNIGGIDVQPVTSPIAFDDAGAFSTQPIALLNVPIFLTPDGGASTPSNVVVLPLRNASIQKATVSNNGDCIGAFDLKALDTTCSVADPSSCSKWRTAGSLGGAITLEDADKVPLTILPETLCVLLTGASKSDAGGCARDGQGKIIATGDYCSTTGKPGDCKDSFWLSATFAAAAVTINDGTGEPTCQGGAGDAGTDSGADSGDAAGD